MRLELDANSFAVYRLEKPGARTPSYLRGGHDDGRERVPVFSPQACSPVGELAADNFGGLSGSGFDEEINVAVVSLLISRDRSEQGRLHHRQPVEHFSDVPEQVGGNSSLLLEQELDWARPDMVLIPSPEERLSGCFRSCKARILQIIQYPGGLGGGDSRLPCNLASGQTSGGILPERSKDPQVGGAGEHLVERTVETQGVSHRQISCIIYESYSPSSLAPCGRERASVLRHTGRERAAAASRTFLAARSQEAAVGGEPGRRETRSRGQARNWFEARRPPSAARSPRLLARFGVGTRSLPKMG